MLYSEIIAVCSEIHTKHINTLCGQNVELLNVKHGGTYNERSITNGLAARGTISTVRPVSVSPFRGLKSGHVEWYKKV
jgi:hypothetical protein